MSLFRIGSWLVCSLMLSPSLASIQLQDDSRQQVTLAQPAQRIVSLAPHITELLFAAGAGAHVVGTVLGSDYPAAAARITTVGEFDNLALTQIMSLRPDLVIASRSGNSHQQVDQLRRLGVPIFYSEPLALMDVANSIMRFAQMAGTEDAAQLAQSAYLKNYIALKKHFAARSTVRVFFQMGSYPLTSVNRQHMISEVIEVCGGRNISADIEGMIGEVDQESVLAAKPDVIIANSVDGARPPWLDFWRRWADLPAVKSDQLYSLDAAIISRPSPRILLGARQICQWLEQARSRDDKEDK